MYDYLIDLKNNVYGIKKGEDTLVKCLVEGVKIESNKCKAKKPAKQPRQSKEELYKLVVCPVCGKTFTQFLLNSHINQEHGTEAIKCSKCDFVAKSQGHLEYHEKSHKVFPCEICGKPQRNKAAYKYHNLTMHTPDNQKPFRCTMCGKGFAKIHKLKEHENIHTNARPFICRYEGCGKSYRSGGMVRVHEKSAHEGISMHKRKVN